MSDLIIGLTVVAIGTSAPEFAVTAVAAIEGQSDISVGNVVGSNIFNLGFILGGLAIFPWRCHLTQARSPRWWDADWHNGAAGHFSE